MSGIELAVLALGIGSAGVGFRLVYELQHETNGNGKLQQARRCFDRARHESEEMRAELRKLQPKAEEGS